MPKRSQLDIAKHKGKVLDQIMAWKREEVPKRMAEAPLEQLKAFAQIAPPALDFAAALKATPGAGIIAEVKRASPSKGLIAREFDPVEMARAYVSGGACAISCLTDARFFQGRLEYLTAIKETLSGDGLTAPVLRKDFIYHEYQLYEARAAGADAILLIVAVLSDRELAALLDQSRSLGMEALVEVHDEAELERALTAGSQVIGVNNRDLRTFDVDLENSARLRDLIPAEHTMVAESGIRTPEDVERLAQMGCDALLVGESFAQLPQRQRADRVRAFAEAGRLRL